MPTSAELAQELLQLKLPSSWVHEGVTITVSLPKLLADDWVKYTVQAEDANGPLPLPTDDFQFLAIPAATFVETLNNTVLHHARANGWAG